MEKPPLGMTKPSNEGASLPSVTVTNSVCTALSNPSATLEENE